MVDTNEESQVEAAEEAGDNAKGSGGKPKREPIPLEDKATRCREAVTKMVGLLGVEPETMEVSVDGDQLVLAFANVSSPNGVELDMRAYEALQFFANKAMNRGAAKRTRLQLRVDGAQGRRNDGFSRVAAHLAYKSRKYNLSFAVGFQDPRERDALNQHLSRQDGVVVESLGHEAAGSLQVSPKPAEEGHDNRRRRRRRRR